MEEAPFSNEVALRIGLAARVLPNVSVAELIEALESLSPDSIDEAALARVTVTQLKASFNQRHDVDGDEENEGDFRSQDMAAFKEAVRILWGDTHDSEKAPPLVPYQDGDIPGSIRVAIASNSQEDLDGHFGSCLRYLIYQVSAHEVRLIDARPTLAADLSSDKNAFRVSLIKDCKVLYVVSAGGPAAAKVIKADIHLIQIAEGGAARDILGKLQQVLGGRPPPWLAKVVGTAVLDRTRYRSLGD